MGRPSRRLWLALASAAILALAVVAAASAHIERASYWPKPAGDSSVKPTAGGKVPNARSLYTALQKKPPGTTRIVCTGRVPSVKRSPPTAAAVSTEKTGSREKISAARVAEVYF